MSLTGEEKKKYNKEYYERNKIKLREQKREYYLKNKVILKEKGKKYQVKYKENNPDKLKERQLQRYYKISLADYKKLFETQKGCCAICGIHQEDYTKLLHVDHCHDTGKVRGLLCSPCNTVLGMAKDDVDILEKAIKYLHKAKDVT